PGPTLWGHRAVVGADRLASALAKPPRGRTRGGRRRDVFGTRIGLTSPSPGGSYGLVHRLDSPPPDGQLHDPGRRRGGRPQARLGRPFSPGSRTVGGCLYAALT